MHERKQKPKMFDLIDKIKEKMSTENIWWQTDEGMKKQGLWGPP